MRGQYKSAVTLTFISIVCLIVALLLVAMKKLYIESWFMLNRNVVTGLVSGLLITSIFSFSNLVYAQRSHARERASLLDSFSAQSASFLSFLGGLKTKDGTLDIPPAGQYDLGQALALLHERANAVLRSERISPLKGTAVQQGGMFVSPLAKSEYAFELAFSEFEQGCNEAYQLHSSLPYLADRSEQDRLFEDFLRQLRELALALDSGSALQATLALYRSEIRKLLGGKREKG